MRFNGRPVEAYAGDTAASALRAGGIHHVARSFKYHRPRGILSHGSEEPNALLTVDRGGGRIEPNARATCVALRLGVSSAPSPTSQSAFGSSAPAARMPRGRWYLKERPTRWTPLASSAEATVSPSSAS